jgi:hypothetical protein
LTGDARTLAATTVKRVRAAKRILSPCRITRLVGWTALFFFLSFFFLFWFHSFFWDHQDSLTLCRPVLWTIDQARTLELCFVSFLEMSFHYLLFKRGLRQSNKGETQKKKREKSIGSADFYPRPTRNSRMDYNPAFDTWRFYSFSRPLIPRETLD